MIPFLNIRYFWGSVSSGRISARFPPATITRDCHFNNNFTTLRVFSKSISQNHHFWWSHFRTFAIFEGAAVVAGFLPDSHSLQLRGISTFPILRLYEYFPKSISHNRHFWWSPFWTFAISGGAAVVAGFLPDPHPLQLRGISAFPILRLYEYFPKSISRIITSDDPIFELSIFLRERQ